MELELTLKIIEVKKYPETKTVEEGLTVQFYGDSNNWIIGIDEPTEGVVKKDDIGFYIDWEYSGETRIDDSKNSKDILKNCGWGC